MSSMTTIVMTDGHILRMQSSDPITSLEELPLNRYNMYDAAIIITDDGLVLKNRFGPAGKIVGLAHPSIKGNNDSITI